jgi:hypothetical protein
MSDTLSAAAISRRQHVGLRPEDTTWVQPYAKLTDLDALYAEIDELRARIEVLETELAELVSQGA